jgi:flagellin-like protein
VNRIIRAYSGIEGTAVLVAVVLTFVPNLAGAHGRITKAAIKKMNVSTTCESDVTWNRPL